LIDRGHQGIHRKPPKVGGHVCGPDFSTWSCSACVPWPFSSSTASCGPSDSHRPSTTWEHRLHRSIGQSPENRYLRRGLRFFWPFSLYGVNQHGLRVKSMKPASVLKSCRNAHRNSPPLGAMDTVNVNRPVYNFAQTPSARRALRGRAVRRRSRCRGFRSGCGPGRSSARGSCRA
jgi:hypothetical protein